MQRGGRSRRKKTASGGGFEVALNRVFDGLANCCSHGNVSKGVRHELGMCLACAEHKLPSNWHGTMPVHRRPEPAGVDSVRLSMRRTKGINRNIQAHVWPSKKLAPGACIATEGFRCSPGPLQWAWQYQEVVCRQGTSNPISGHAPVAGRALASASIAPNTITEITCERILAGRQRKQ